MPTDKEMITQTLEYFFDALDNGKGESLIYPNIFHELLLT
jgi:hypothetical protein